MDLNDNIITLETAKLAKEKGFNISGDKYYHEQSPLGTKEDYRYSLKEGKRNNHISEAWQYLAPTQSLLQKWLREEHNIHIRPDLPFIKNGWQVKGFSLIDGNELFSITKYKMFNSYEEALEKGLQEALRSIK